MIYWEQERNITMTYVKSPYIGFYHGITHRAYTRGAIKFDIYNLFHSLGVRARKESHPIRTLSLYC